MILRKTVLAAGALVALLASASVGSAKPAAPANSGAAAPVQCSTKLLTLRPHYPDPVKEALQELKRERTGPKPDGLSR